MILLIPFFSFSFVFSFPAELGLLDIRGSGGHAGGLQAGPAFSRNDQRGQSDRLQDQGPRAQAGVSSRPGRF